MKMTKKIKTYTELITIKSFEGRFEYCKLPGSVGTDIFGSHRVFNQRFYKSSQWLRFRNLMIVRDQGRDLAMPGYEIQYEPIYIHHLNPITEQDLEEYTKALLDPENVVCVRFSTHNKLHYGDEPSDILKEIPQRYKNDMCPWRK